MKILFTAGQSALKGTYLDPETGKRIDLDADGILPGDENTKYLRLPPLGMLPVALAVGFLYVISLPFIGIATVVSMCAVPVLGCASGMLVFTGKAIGVLFNLREHNRAMTWTPARAYLAGKKDN